MKGSITIIQIDGAKSGRHIDVEHYHALVEAVGGGIELVSGFTNLKGQPCHAYVNEDGIATGLAPNPTASELWWKCLDAHPRLANPHSVLQGAVAIVTGDRAFLRAAEE